MLRTLVMIATVLAVLGLALLLVRVTSNRSLSRQHTIPMQRSPLTEAELAKLNQAYGAGEIGEAEYTRRRKELLSRLE